MESKRIIMIITGQNSGLRYLPGNLLQYDRTEEHKFGTQSTKLVLHVVITSIDIVETLI